MDLKRFQYLYNQYLVEALTDEEAMEWRVLLCNEQLAGRFENNIEWFNENQDTLLGLPDNKVEQLVKTIIQYPQQRYSLRLWPRFITAAAIALMMLGAGLFYFSSGPGHTGRNLKVHKIVPGGNKATLTFANGKVISLSDQKKRVKIDIKGALYADGESVGDYDENAGASAQILTASTPRGGIYEIVLPDGSKVTLNAASMLRFPSGFPDHGKRSVELVSGEAYFEVKKDKLHPFIVKGSGQEIEVLGTRFNIKAYPEEQSVRTTLLEGAVKVNNARVLKPGEQAVLEDKTLSVIEVNTEEAVAWKNGTLFFDANNFENTMNMIARWYDVDVVYDYKPIIPLAGKISRTRSITEVLQLMQKTDEVKFKIEGRRIRVIK